MVNFSCLRDPPPLLLSMYKHLVANKGDLLHSFIPSFIEADKSSAPGAVVTGSAIAVFFQACGNSPRTCMLTVNVMRILQNSIETFY